MLNENENAVGNSLFTVHTIRAGTEGDFGEELDNAVKKQAKHGRDGELRGAQDTVVISARAVNSESNTYVARGNDTVDLDGADIM